MSKLVVALGGNAISANAAGTAEQQYASVYETCGHIADLIADGHCIVITHGNGPQVGNALIQNEAGARLGIPPMPLDVCGAMTQGQIGYMIARAMVDHLRRRGDERPVVSVVTQVLVSPKDPAFGHPTKPIGPYYDTQTADKLRAGQDYTLKEVKPGKWRRVVPSPRPLGIVEWASIRALVEHGAVVIAAGGGGIPVAECDGRLIGVEAVIDKDYASARLALDIEAEALVILTDVDRVMLDFGKPNARSLDKLTAADAQRYLDEGQFPEGSMGPKVRAAADFVLGGGDRAIISSLASSRDALVGKQGTTITTE